MEKSLPALISRTLGTEDRSGPRLEATRPNFSLLPLSWVWVHHCMPKGCLSP